MLSITKYRTYAAFVFGSGKCIASSGIAVDILYVCGGLLYEGCPLLGGSVEVPLCIYIYYTHIYIKGVVELQLQLYNA